MTKLSWIRTRSTRPAPRRKASARLVLESLEDRCVPATFTVNSFADTAAPPTPTVTLRSAITAANAATAQPNFIAFDPALTGQTILLTANLPAITNAVTITGLGQNSLTIDGAGLFQPFTVNAGVGTTITDLTIRRGLSGGAGTNGGAILNNGNNLVLQRDTLTQNNAANTGGGLENSTTGVATISDCSFLSNQSNGTTAGGGAISNEGQMVINTSTIAGNIAVFGGAGIDNFNGGTIGVNRCAIYGNIAGNNTTGVGGGFRNNSTSAVAASLTNTTIAYNTATGSTGGGGVSTGNGTVTILNCTIVANADTSGSASGAGGISIIAGTVNLTNSIVAQNHGDPNTADNTFTAPGATLNQATNIISAIQVVGPLQNNGGPTLSMAPLPNLAAAINPIDAGTNAAASTLTTDQRGFARVVGPKVDIGAVEFQPPGVSVAITVTIPPNPGPPTTPPTPPPLGPAAPANLAFHRVVTISVTVTNATASPNPNNAPVTGTVTFLVNGTTVLGTAPLDATGKATFTTTSAVPLPLGSDTITARYNGDANYNPGVSNAVAETVARPIPTPAVFDPATATWYIKNSFGAGPPSSTAFQFGSPGDLPIMGDWTGSGTFGIGVFTPSTATFRLRNSASAGPPDFTFVFGPVNIGIPVAGDWNGTGVWGVGVYGQARGDFNLRTQPSSGIPDAGSFLFGSPGSKPVAGDWTGSGTFSVGVIDSADNTWKLKNIKATGTPDFTFQYGNFADQHVVGDWDGNGTWTPGVLQDNGSGSLNWLLRNSNSGGAPDIAPFLYGASTFLGVVGDPDFPVVPQFAADGQGPGAGAISQADLNNAVQADLARLQQAGVSPDVLARLSGVTALLAGLQPGQLGGAVLQGNQILLSPNGAGHGWFVDPTPMQDEEFSGGQALPGSAADGRYDLQTVVMHELGHIVGLPDDSSNGLMGTTIGEGTRRLDALNAVFAG